MTSELYPQAAVIPYRVNADDQPEVLLTRRPEKNKWGIPKGIVEPGASMRDTAREEAVEEAGVTGELSGEPVGYFSFKKWGGICHVTVFLMRVTEVHPEYPEKDRRERQWFGLTTAAEVARRKRVRSLIADLPSLIKQHNM